MKIRTKWLKDFFRNTYKVASAYITRLSSWSSVEPNDGTGLKEFFIAPERARNVLTGMQYVNDSDTANFLGQMWERYLRSKWTERVSKNRSNKGQAANFNNLCQFVSEQADLATDAVYSEKELSSHELYLVLQKAPPGWMCWVSKKPQVDRKDFVTDKGLCFGCYSSEHIAKFGKSRRSCQICNKKHPTSLHDHNWRPEEVRTEGRKQPAWETTERKREERVNVRTAIPSVTKAGDIPSTVGTAPVCFYQKDNPNNKIYVYALLDSVSGWHVEIGLLIGLNCPSTVSPRNIICGNEDEPYAVRSALRWHSVRSPFGHHKKQGVTSHLQGT